MHYDNLIFLHIPKAAGSTLHPVLGRHYVGSQIRTISLPEQLARFQQEPVETRGSVRLLKGHMPFGMHEWLSGVSRYVTLLRHPVERVVSHYYYVKRRPGHYLHDHVSKGMTLRDYASAGLSGELDNGQVRLLAGHDQDLPIGACTETLLNVAKRNVETHFAVAGLTERFDESLAMMQCALAWNWTPYYLNKNVTEGKPSGRQIPDDAVEAIVNANGLDIALYEWVQRRFDMQLEAERQTIELNLARLRQASRLYRPWGMVVDGVKHRARSGLRALRIRA